MQKVLVVIAVALLLTTIVASSSVRALTPHETAMNVAITKGLEYLNSTQAGDGHVGELYYVGETGLYLVALLQNNVSKADTHVQGALSYILSQNHTDGSIYSSTDEICYATACAIMGLVAYNDSAYLGFIKNGSNYILTCQAPDGSFGYNSGAGSGDLSNSQYAILGLRDGELAGWTPPSQTPYTNLANWVKTQQNGDGGYGTYSSASSGAGTSAAIVCLVLSGVSAGDSHVAGGINWLKNHYSYTINPGYDWLNAYYYYLYGATKALTFTGITNTVGGLMDPTTAPNPGVAGDRGWYFDFTEHLVDTQNATNGDWPADSFYGEHIIEDIFSVLVLEKAVVVTAPLAVGGEIVPVDILEMLAPYMLIGLFAAATSALLLRYRKRII